MPLPPSGIYKITNLQNGKVYIGQSQNIYFRRKQHFTALRTHRHENTQMQKDGNTDSHSFRGDVVEYCSLDKLNEREEYWINYYNSIDDGYNQGGVPYKRKQKKIITKRKVKGYRKTR